MMTFRAKMYRDASLREKLLHRFLKFLGKGQWSPFLRSMRHLGKPAPVAFPTELLDQGMGLILTGLNNSLAFQSHIQWVLPYWVEKQSRPYSIDFIPSGVNVLTMNLTHRNWTSLGVPGSSVEAMMDPVGMIFPGPFEPSVFPFLKFAEQGYFPPQLAEVEQKITSASHTTLHTHYPCQNGIEWEGQSFAFKTQEQNWVALKYTLKNTAIKTQKFAFGLALRPYNSLAFAPIFRIKFKKNSWRINGKVMLVLGEGHDECYIASRHQQDPLLYPTKSSTLKMNSRSGWISGQSEWNLELKSSESKTIWAFMPISPKSGLKKLSEKEIIDLQEEAAQQSQIVHDPKGAHLVYPNESLENMIQLLRNRLHVFDDGTHFSPGTYFYHDHWIRDSVFLAMCFDDWGCSDSVTEKIPYWMKMQRWDGEFRSHSGEWDSTGQILFMVIRHIRMTNQLSLYKTYEKKILKGLKWIERKRNAYTSVNSLVHGLLPAGFSAEHFGVNDQYFWDNLWSLAAYEEWISFAKDCLNHKDTIYWDECLVSYIETVESIIHSQLRNWHGGFAISPTRLLDASCVGNLVAIQPLNIQGMKMSWVQVNLDYLYQNHIHQGLFFQPISHTGYNIYLTCQIAKAMQVVNDVRWFELFTAVRKAASPTFCWPEAIHPHSQGGCMGDGDHGWAVAEFLSLFRNALLREQGSVLLLLPNLPSEIWQLKQRLHLIDFPTTFGKVNLNLCFFQGSWRLYWKLERSHCSRLGPLNLILPPQVQLEDKVATLVELENFTGVWQVADEGEIHFSFE